MRSEAKSTPGQGAATTTRHKVLLRPGFEAIAEAPEITVVTEGRASARFTGGSVAARPSHSDALRPRPGELGEVAVADDAAELLLGFEHARRGPAQRHVAGLPALDVARRAADALDQRLARVGGLERALQRAVDPEPCHRQCFLKASRSDAAAPGCERASSSASAYNRLSAAA
jgi:hypothetical protein